MRIPCSAAWRCLLALGPTPLVFALGGCSQDSLSPVTELAKATPSQQSETRERGYPHQAQGEAPPRPTVGMASRRDVAPQAASPIVTGSLPEARVGVSTPTPPQATWHVSPRGQPIGQTSSPTALTAGSHSRSGRIVQVQEGDTLYGIARRHGLSVAALVDANRLSSTDITPGQQLVLPAVAR